MTVDREKIEELTRELLVAIGEEPERPGLKDTPRRVAGFWSEFVDYEPGNLEVVFESTSVDQMVLLREIPFYSLCEHHVLPISGWVTVAYLTGEDKKVIGLSKLARLVQQEAHRLQVQEDFADRIAKGTQKLLPGARGVAVYVEAEHFCMKMRGIKSNGVMVTSVLLGDFRTELHVRQEFLHLARR